MDQEQKNTINKLLDLLIHKADACHRLKGKEYDLEITKLLRDLAETANDIRDIAKSFIIQGAILRGEKIY